MQKISNTHKVKFTLSGIQYSIIRHGKKQENKTYYYEGISYLKPIQNGHTC